MKPAMLSHVMTASLMGIDAGIVSVEVDISDGLPGWHMVGLPEQVVKESKDRVWSAVKNSGLGFPIQKVTVNFSPADHKKKGTGFDLPLAVGLLASAELVKKISTTGYLIVGELSLTGRVLPVSGILAMAIAAKENGFKGMIVPDENCEEARLVPDLDVIGCEDIPQVVVFFNEGVRPEVTASRARVSAKHSVFYDMCDVKGQHVARRAMEIAAAGNHNIMLVGPPGTGKTMLAERLPSILPPLTEIESLETTKIYSAMGLVDQGSPLMKERPFRAPHHSASYAGLFGGGSKIPTIGEISLSHNGVLFLDELPEFRKDVVEVLRQPIESGYVHITRAGYSVRYPARFLLSAAMNPCRCGYLGHPKKACVCSIMQIQSYRRKLSGPLLDRIDLRIEVPPLKSGEMMARTESEPSSAVRDRVLKARNLQEERFAGLGILNNARMTSRMIRELCPLDDESTRILKMIVESKGYSARAIDRLIRVSRTIADLDGSAEIRLPHVAEAVQHHRMEKFQNL